MLKKIEKVSTLLAYFGSAALLFMMLLTTVDVAGRYLFNKPIIGVFEITEFLVLILIFSFIAYTQSQKGHVSVELLVMQFPRRWQIVIDLITHTICLALMALIMWMGIKRALHLKVVGETSPNLGVPTYPFVYFLALGCAIMCLQYIIDLIRLFQSLKEKDAP